MWPQLVSLTIQNHLSSSRARNHIRNLDAHNTSSLQLHVVYEQFAFCGIDFACAFFHRASRCSAERAAQSATCHESPPPRRGVRVGVRGTGTSRSIDLAAAVTPPGRQAGELCLRLAVGCWCRGSGCESSFIRCRVATAIGRLLASELLPRLISPSLV